MHICSLAKGTDSDNVRHSGPDTSASWKKDAYPKYKKNAKDNLLNSKQKNNVKHIVIYFLCIKNKLPEGNIVKKPYP